MLWSPSVIISGGQTGVDRGALDAALSHGLRCGGQCPKGRLSEDGTIPDRYPLVECNSTNYKVRTELNVRDSDATLIVCRKASELTGGTKLTGEYAALHKRSTYVVFLDDGCNLELLRAWGTRHSIESLNVAGPRESKSPGITALTTSLISALLEGRESWAP